jgi:hypothetical protein
MANLSHWSTIEDTLRSSANLPLWISGEDQSRVAAYDVYEAMYWTAPESFQISLRGQESKPIFVPAGRKIVDTAHRYLAPKLEVITDPIFGDETTRAAADALMLDFVRRERFRSKFSANKRKGLYRGDWLWHIYADEDRAPGARISIFPLHPGVYFPEYEDDDQIDSVIAVHLAEPTTDSAGNQAVRKLVYRKESETGGPSTILISEGVYKWEAWGQPGADMDEVLVQSILAEEALPEAIDSIPVYHIPNVYDPEEGWGSSEMRGVERLLTAINQGITDEELTLILEGLGVYVTTAGAPVDEEGNEVPWNLGPARVVELPADTDFKRVNGAGAVTPFQDHLKYLHQEVDDTTGTNDVTRGRADVQVAESGIALAIRMGPLLARMDDKELVVTDIHNQMFFDLRKWFSAVEGIGGLDEIRWIPRYGEKMFINRAELFRQVMEMYNAAPVPLISGVEARRIIREKVGYDFNDDETQMFGDIVEEQSTFAGVVADMTASRIAGEVDDLGGA